MGTAVIAADLILISLMISSAAAYTNHTVGGDAGWFFNATTTTSATNYSSWAANQTFSLGDYLSNLFFFFTFNSLFGYRENRLIWILTSCCNFCLAFNNIFPHFLTIQTGMFKYIFLFIFLVFKTNSNHTVIETYNKTIYLSCAYDDSEDDDTIQYGGGNQNFSQALTIEVQLTNEGSTYYFSSAGHGVQCQHGMAFEINVAHGAGLPPATLNQAPPPPFNEPPGPDSAQSPAETVAGATPSGNGAFRIGGGLCGLLPLLLILL